MPWSSNGTFLVEVACGDDSTLAIYKPGRGERPLWDFPNGLYRREVAAWLLSARLGWHVVPETVLRDGPLGEGSVQRFVMHDPEVHHFTLVEDEAHHERLRRICAFDVIANNTDRKSGHCLLGEDGRIWAIDNGLCFHPDPKLRTVIWEFGSETVPTAVVADIERLLAALPAGLDTYLDEEELDAMAERARQLVQAGTFPIPDEYHRPYPWPLV
jgi:uncharacterized repeat protein (TIGR03843 family)